MRFLLSGSAIVLLLSLSVFQAGFTSCTKDKTIYDTVVNVDTLVIKDTALTAEILTSHPWKLQEARGVLGDSILYYLRGGSDNTESFDNEYLTFNTDNTGLLIDNAGYSHIMTTWSFENAEKTKLTFTLYNDNVILSTYTWDNIRYKNKNLYYDDYFWDNLREESYHGQETRIPK